MNRALLAPITFGIAAMLVTMPARVYGQDPADHAAHHPAVEGAPAPAPPAAAAASNAAKLDALVKKMNAAKGQEKIDATAELLTVMVQEHQSMHGNMSHMMSMMQKMGGAAGK